MAVAKKRDCGQTLTFSTRLNRADVSGILEALTDGLKEGVLHVQKSGESLEMQVPKVIDLEVKASLCDGLACLSIETSWREKPIEVQEEPVKKNRARAVKKRAE